ncbi:MAG: hypothetical protein ACRD2T_06685, partial [Thermoanaerobaculia bacterium]
LEVIGPNVFLNDQPARDGEAVYEDDSVSTGADSSAIVRTADGQYIQLDERTDPRFRFEVRETDGRRCVYLYIKVGRVWVDGDVVCFETPDVTGVLDSAVDIDARGKGTRVTVVDGTALITRPERQRLEAGERAVVVRGIVRVEQLSRRELRAVTRWRERFEVVRGWCCDERSSRVYQGTAEECERAGARSFDSEEAAQKACAVEPVEPVEPEGWCCSHTRRVFRGTKRTCGMRGATFYEEEADARQACAKPEIEATAIGYCCTKDGSVRRLNQKQCLLAGGDKLYKTQAEAEAVPRCQVIY